MILSFCNFFFVGTLTLDLAYLHPLLKFILMSQLRIFEMD